MMIGYFSICSAFRCAMFYMFFFITFVEKASVIAQPLSPPIFEKIAPEKTKRFLILLLYVCVFYVFSFFVDFRLPLPPPLAQIGPICGRIWSHFSKTFHFFVHKASLGSAAVPVRALQYTKYIR